LPFDVQPEAGTLAQAGVMSSLGSLNLMSMIQIGVLSLVALILGLFVLRPMLTQPMRSKSELPAPAQPLALTGGSNPADGRVLTGEIAEDGDLPPLSVVSGRLSDPQDDNADPVTRLRRLIEARQAESVEILRGWMEHDEERVG